MENKKIKIDIDYRNMPIYTEYNADKINYPLLLSVPHSGTYFPPEFLQNVKFDEKNLRRNKRCG